MSIDYQVKIRAESADGKKRTITFNNFHNTIDEDTMLQTFANKFQPVITDSITSVECYRIRSIDNFQPSVQPGVDNLPNSTKDSTIFHLENDIGAKNITISNSASAVESDTEAFAAYATAVYEFGDELTTYVLGDYAITDVTLRAMYDYEIENPD